MQFKGEQSHRVNSSHHLQAEQVRETWNSLIASRVSFSHPAQLIWLTFSRCIQCRRYLIHMVSVWRAIMINSENARVGLRSLGDNLWCTHCAGPAPVDEAGRYLTRLDMRVYQSMAGTLAYGP